MSGSQAMLGPEHDDDAVPDRSQGTEPTPNMPRPEVFGHTVILGGEPIPCTTWLLKDEDARPIYERRRMTELIGNAIGRLGDIESKRRLMNRSSRSEESRAERTSRTDI